MGKAIRVVKQVGNERGFARAVGAESTILTENHAVQAGKMDETNDNVVDLPRLRE